MGGMRPPGYATDRAMGDNDWLNLRVEETPYHMVTGVVVSASVASALNCRHTGSPSTPTDEPAGRSEQQADLYGLGFLIYQIAFSTKPTERSRDGTLSASGALMTHCRCPVVPIFVLLLQRC